MASSRGMGDVSGRLVALLLPPGPRFVAELHELWGRGAAILPLDARLPAPELRRALAELKPGVVVDSEGATTSPDGVAVGPGAALVIRTSGSTGRPRGVELTHGALEASARASLERLEAAPGERWLCCLPPDHIAGMQVLVRSLVGGSEPVIHERFEVAAFARERRAAFVSLVPTMLRRLLDAGDDLSGWRAILLGGAPADGSLLARARAEGANVVTTYGMTETCGGVVYDGRPLNDVEIALGGRGRISIRAPMLMSGYRLRPDQTSATLSAGWFQTSDRGRLLADGALQVVGRLDDIIISGGEKIAPSEVASLLEEHPSIQHAFVYGRPDPHWGERVVAAIVPAPGAEPSLDELRDFAAARAAAYKAPREVVIVRHPSNIDGPSEGMPEP